MLEKIATGAEAPAHPVHLIYGVTYDKDLVELDRLKHYAEAIRRLHL